MRLLGVTSAQRWMQPALLLKIRPRRRRAVPLMPLTTLPSRGQSRHAGVRRVRSLVIFSKITNDRSFIMV
jgi:hypothetical protein